MECLQLRSQPEPFHYLISEQAKSIVALQELQNEVGALLEFRDLVIETFPNLRSKMSPSRQASGTRRDWEPGVRVRRKLASGSGGDTTRAKPQPSVQDSGFSTETSCGKDAHSSASRSRPLEDELWALLDVIQRKGGRLRDDAELLRGELDLRTDTAEESFARALSDTACGNCAQVQRLRSERDTLLARTAQLEAQAAATSATSTTPPAHQLPATGSLTPVTVLRPTSQAVLGRLDSTLELSPCTPRIPSPDSKKFAAILLESNPVELQRQLLASTVHNQVLRERVKRVLAQRALLFERLDRAKDLNDDLKFRLEEKTIEAEGARARVRQLEGNSERERGRDAYTSMRDMEPLPIPGTNEETTRRSRPSRIPLHTSNKGTAPRPPSAHSAHSANSAHSTRSARSTKSAVPVRRSPSSPNTTTSTDTKNACQRQAADDESCDWDGYDYLEAELAEEYVSRLARLQSRLSPEFSPISRLQNRFTQGFSPLNRLPSRFSPVLSPRSLAVELLDSTPNENLWSGKPQQYFEQLTKYDRSEPETPDDYDADSLAP